MSAPKFAVGDVVWVKPVKMRSRILDNDRFAKPGFSTWHKGRRFRPTPGRWYKIEDVPGIVICHESVLAPIPDASEWSFTDLMEEIKSGSGVDA